MRDGINEHADAWREDAQTGAMTLVIAGWRAVIVPAGAMWEAYIEPASADVEGERSEPERLDSRARARAWCEMALARVTAPPADEREAEA
jgi:hypothetical protein